MRMGTQCFRSQRFAFFSAALALMFLTLSLAQPANALPAFARKYGLRCSACHESWPMLNYFGQKFKDNGYQIMNDHDSPIWQNPSYWPATFRITPIWHRVSTGKVIVDTYTGGSATPTGQTIQRLTTTAFDLTGLDFHTGGTLEKNVSFYVLPSSNNLGSFHFETVMGRFDNLFHSPWINLKLGKFELDNLLSEKRILTLTTNGGIYQLYHFRPQGDGNIFGQMGDTQLGVELMGHSWNDRTRYSAALLSTVDGQPGIPYGSNAYSGFFTFSQAFDTGKLGVDRIGGYAMLGEAPTSWRTVTTGSGTSVTTTPIPGGGLGNKSFHREGFVGLFYFGEHFDVQVVTQHGWDSAWFGQGYGDFIDGIAPNNNTTGTTLPPGSRAPTWNGILVEPHYIYSPQLIFIGRFEALRISQQSTPGIPQDFGNLTTYTVGYRYNPFMNNRAGFAWHNEYNWLHSVGTGPTLGLGTPNINTSELLLGFDFDF
jgi:hypothetical protein